MKTYVNLFFVNFLGIACVNLYFIRHFLVLFLNKTCIRLNFNCCLSFYSFFNHISVKLSFLKRILSNLSSLNTFHYKKLSLYGIGFKSWLFKNNNKYSYVILKIGFSFDICFFISSRIKILCLKPTLILIKGLNKNITNQISVNLCSIRKWNLYKNKGVFFFKKTLPSNNKIVKKL